MHKGRPKKKICEMKDEEKELQTDKSEILTELDTLTMKRHMTP